MSSECSGSDSRGGRDSAAELSRKRNAVAAAPLLQQSIDALSESVVILNSRRQVLMANRRLLDLLQCSLDEVLGQRSGEIVGCCQAEHGPDGCGTAPACHACGALLAVTTSQRDRTQTTRECRLVLKHPVAEALDLRVTATPVDIGDETFTIAVFKDIGDEKRLAVLSRMFFHDVLNTAGGIQGYVELLEQQTPHDSEEAAELGELHELADNLVEEISAQRDLVYAESGELATRWAVVDVPALLTGLATFYRRHPVATGREIVAEVSRVATVVSDERLLRRVLGNMLKNALEASPRGTPVTLSCDDVEGQVVFGVSNSGAMAPEVQLQIFQRSFSTKGGTGRGIGTHSMKLLGERYLQGRVTFTSCASDGTTFRLSIPRAPAK